MSRKTKALGGRRSLMQRAADAQRMVKIILKSLDYEPISVQRLSDEFGVDRSQIRKDISLWLQNYGHECPDRARAITNWRDSHVAPNKIRDGYIDLALKLTDDRLYDLKTVSEILGVDYQQLSYWMRQAGVEPSYKDKRRRAEERFASSAGDLTLREQLENMRQEMIISAREEFRDEITAAEAL